MSARAWIAFAAVSTVPVIAAGLGVVFLAESPGPGAVAGLPLVLAGSWLSTDGRLPPGWREFRGE